MSQGTMTHGKALQLILMTIVGVGGFLVLSGALGLESVWVPFLFLTYWAGIDLMNFERLPACILGPFVALTVAYGFRVLPTMMGPMGVHLVQVVVLGMVYLLILGRLSAFINLVGFITLTVTTIPVIMQTASFPMLYASLALGVVYFPSLIWIGQQIDARRRRPAV